MCWTEPARAFVLPPAARWRALWVVAIVAACGPGAGADVFHLTTGGTVEGKLLSTGEDGTYEIRTVAGIVHVPGDAVQRIEESETPFDEYERRRQQAADTPADQVALAAWCDEQDLRAERRRHLRRAVELDPDHVPARRALGYVRIGELWVDGRRVIERKDRAAATQEAEAAEKERLPRAIQGQWRRRIGAIKRSLLDSAVERLVDDGRKHILEIRDPLAILPLAEVLGGGRRHCRLLLVEALSAFPEDEATMNLALLALVDGDRQVRRRALREVAKRQDPRVSAQYREALYSDSDVILRRAAEGLGTLQAGEAVPDLIAVLTAEQHKWVEVPVRRYFRGWPGVFNRTTVVGIGGGSQVSHQPRLGVPQSAWDFGGGVKNEWRYRWVTVYRTEVLEALKQITGQNFGFEVHAWWEWHEELNDEAKRHNPARDGDGGGQPGE